jgi:hypothetical protein
MVSRGARSIGTSAGDYRHLCRGPELNWRHMVLQPFVQAILGIAPELTTDDEWFDD